MRRYIAHPVDWSDTSGEEYQERDSSFTYSSLREARRPQLVALFQICRWRAGSIGRWALCSGASFSCFLCSSWAPLYQSLKISSSWGSHKAEQSALWLRIYPPSSLGDVPGRWGNWLAASLTLWKDKYMKRTTGLMAGGKLVFLVHKGRVSCCKVLEDGSFYFKKELFVLNVLDIFSSRSFQMASKAQKQGKTLQWENALWWSY